MTHCPFFPGKRLCAPDQDTVHFQEMEKQQKRILRTTMTKSTKNQVSAPHACPPTDLQGSCLGVTCPIPPLPRLLLPSSVCSCLSITPANVWSVSLFVFAFTGAHMGNSKLTQITAWMARDAWAWAWQKIVWTHALSLLIGITTPLWTSGGEGAWARGGWVLKSAACQLGYLCDPNPKKNSLQFFSAEKKKAKK